MMTNFLIFWQNLHLINTYWKLDSLFYLGIVTHKEVFCQIVKAGVMQILTQIEKKKKRYISQTINEGDNWWFLQIPREKNAKWIGL